jgi:hypothetical protein
LVISDITRRSFSLAASASVICAPVIVRAASLMPVRAVGPIEPQYYGELSRAGMSAYGIAAELNRRKVSAINGVAWDAPSVISATNLMKILEPNWRNCPPFKSFLAWVDDARHRLQRWISHSNSVSRVGACSVTPPSTTRV